MKVDDLFDATELASAVANGHVRAQHHPVFPWLEILNYTEKCAYERAWNPVTTQCRGLIWDTDTRKVLARPFRKFFGHSEPGAYVPEPDEPVVVTEKQDGSLAIGFPTVTGWEIATRGSFTSEQALHATGLWRKRYADSVTLQEGITPLWEVLYPQNRIVVDYEGIDDLVLLGAVNIATGRSLTPGDAAKLIGWPGPVTEVFLFRTFMGALEAEPRRNREGFVFHFPVVDERTKWKYEAYRQLHRIVTNCTARRLWESLAVWACQPNSVEFLVRRLCLSPDRVNQVLAAGPDWLDTFEENTPEEFRTWVEDRVAELRTAVRKRQVQLVMDFHVVKAGAGLSDGDPGDREHSKRFAAAARDRTGVDFNLVMALWRGHDVLTAVWREVRPEHELPYRATDEATA